jgi:hypothetical protein
LRVAFFGDSEARRRRSASAPKNKKLKDNMKKITAKDFKETKFYYPDPRESKEYKRK